MESLQIKCVPKHIAHKHGKVKSLFIFIIFRSRWNGRYFISIFVRMGRPEHGQWPMYANVYESLNCYLSGLILASTDCEIDSYAEDTWCAFRTCRRHAFMLPRRSTASPATSCSENVLAVAKCTCKNENKSTCEWTCLFSIERSKWSKNARSRWRCGPNVDAFERRGGGREDGYCVIDDYWLLYVSEYKRFEWDENPHIKSFNAASMVSLSLPMCRCDANNERTRFSLRTPLKINSHQNGNTYWIEPSKTN